MVSERAVRQSVNRVRARLAWLSLAAPLICTLILMGQFWNAQQDGDEFPLFPTLGHVWGFYLPVLTAVLTFLWTQTPVSGPDYAPAGREMAALRDRITLAVFAVILAVPIVIYALLEDADANTLMVAYQAGVQSITAAGVGYYFKTAAPTTPIARDS